MLTCFISLLEQQKKIGHRYPLWIDNVPPQSHGMKVWDTSYGLLNGGEGKEFKQFSSRSPVLTLVAHLNPIKAFAGDITFSGHERNEAGAELEDSFMVPDYWVRKVINAATRLTPKSCHNDLLGKVSPLRKSCQLL